MTTLEIVLSVVCFSLIGFVGWLTFAIRYWEQAAHGWREWWTRERDRRQWLEREASALADTVRTLQHELAEGRE